MTWIDERLFGWSRSAKHGTSAWSGLPTPSIESHNGTPNETDDEEAPDYDNVLGFFPEQEQSVTPRGSKSRSRNNSYADLQRLRMSNAEGEPATLMLMSVQDGSNSTQRIQILPLHI